MNSINKISSLIIIPVYNSADSLRTLINRLDKFVCRSNLLIVNDGSTDNSMEIINELELNHLWFRKNRGKGSALNAGFQYAIANNYKSVITIDSDLQHPPEILPLFYSHDDGATLVLGTRKITTKNTPLPRFASNTLTSILISIFSMKRIRDSQSGFRLIPIQLLKRITLKGNRFDLESELLLKAGKRDIDIIEVEIPTIYDDSSRSNSSIKPVGDTLRFIRQIWRRIWL